MFKKILVPVELSQLDKKILQFTLGLKSIGVEQVILIHVIDDRGMSQPFPPDVVRKLFPLLEERAEFLRKDGFKCKYFLKEGVPHEKILEASEKTRVSMIVSGSRGKRLIDEVLHGSTSEIVGRKSSVPVLLIRYHILDPLSESEIQNLGKNIFRKIFHPTDFSDCSKRALKFIKSLKPNGETELVVVHVVEEEEAKAEEKRKEIRQSEAILNGMKGELEKLNFRKVKTKVLSGSILDELLKFAAKVNPSSIVIGSHGKGITQEILVGSVSQDVIRMAKQPVIIIH